MSALLEFYPGTTREAVLEVWDPFSVRFEGRVPFMYLDRLGLVTTGMGNLIDPIEQAHLLPWRRLDGTLATTEEVTACWGLVKGHTELCQRGGMAYGKLTGNNLRLSEGAIDALIQRKLFANERELKRRFPDFDTWPADAQLGIHSMAWAMGAAFGFPKFASAVNRRPPNFRLAASECHMWNGAPARNAANEALFIAAAVVVETGADPDVLTGWPVPPEVA